MQGRGRVFHSLQQNNSFYSSLNSPRSSKTCNISDLQPKATNWFAVIFGSGAEEAPTRNSNATPWKTVG
ncbi:hypothetical protein Q1695_013694 [Nippostrongylus brasiliensis]|nr:hypothetical protein Q1695_013694 [Nippostrongylus brasiliensis]